MAGSSKANQRQGTRRKPQYTRYKTEGRKDKNKKLRMARDARNKERAEAKLFKRVREGKPVPVRFLKRHGLFKK
jgi:hypothetical protein